MKLLFTVFATSLLAIANSFGNVLPNLVRGRLAKTKGSSDRQARLSQNAFWWARMASKSANSNTQMVGNPGEDSSHGFCSQPCQRVPHLVKFQHALIMNGVDSDIGSMLTSKNVDENGFIDVGRCLGSCRKVESQLIRVSLPIYTYPHLPRHNQQLPLPIFTLILF